MARAFPESLPEFQRLFPNETRCAAYLEETRWEDGFQCQYCGWEGDPYRFEGRPTVLRCRKCQRDTSLTAGTVMERSHTPLCIWFWGAYLVASHTPGMSALQFQRQLGLTRYETAFQMLHKLRAGMVNPDRERIAPDGGLVEVDETLVGGKTRGEGRGVHHKAIVVGAVEVRVSKKKRRSDRDRKPRLYAGRMRLEVIDDRGKRTLEKFVAGAVEPGAHVRTDGWQGYDGLSALGYKHEPLALRGDSAAIEAHLPMIHLLFSNLKAWIQGTHHGVSQQHLQAYLNEYTFRFNRRFYPFNAFNSVLRIAVRVEGPTYEELYSGGWVHPTGAP